jgi:hypothetical protein
VQQIDGEYWFTAKYAASLLGTSRKKIESMAIREIVRARADGESFLIAESDVTRLRRDPETLAQAKDAARMPGDPRKGETMPSTMTYKGDPFPDHVTAEGRARKLLKLQRGAK